MRLLNLTVPPHKWSLEMAKCGIDYIKFSSQFHLENLALKIGHLTLRLSNSNPCKDAGYPREISALFNHAELGCMRYFSSGGTLHLVVSSGALNPLVS